MRFTPRNWLKFFDLHNKKTTLRLKQTKLGKHKAWAGSYYEPILLGEFEIIKVVPIRFDCLTLQDALDDGFETLELLKEELQWLNKDLDEQTMLYQHWCVNVKEAKPTDKDERDEALYG